MQSECVQVNRSQRKKEMVVAGRASPGTTFVPMKKEGENEEYNKAGAWEKEYRQNDRLDRGRPTLVRSLRPHPLQSVDCGWNHTVALTVLGEVLVWGGT